MIEFLSWSRNENINGTPPPLSLLTHSVAAPHRHAVPRAKVVNQAAPVRNTGQQTSVLCLPTSSVSAELTT